MSWQAKPSGPYGIESQEAIDNIIIGWSICSSLGYTKEAYSGMMGNAFSESGLNPWRWQSDAVNYSAGYGLFQYTPASGYFNEYGRVFSEFAPNTSTTSITTGAAATDAIAQIKAIESSGKYIVTKTRTDRIIAYYPECSTINTLSKFKQLNSISNATICWLGFFEAPAVINDIVVNTRISNAQKVYDIIGEITPTDYRLLFFKKRLKIRKRRIICQS